MNPDGYSGVAQLLVGANYRGVACADCSSVEPNFSLTVGHSRWLWLRVPGWAPARYHRSAHQVVSPAGWICQDGFQRLSGMQPVGMGRSRQGVPIREPGSGFGRACGSGSPATCAQWAPCGPPGSDRATDRNLGRVFRRKQAGGPADHGEAGGTASDRVARYRSGGLAEASGSYCVRAG